MTKITRPVSLTAVLLLFHSLLVPLLLWTDESSPALLVASAFVVRLTTTSLTTSTTTASCKIRHAFDTTTISSSSLHAAPLLFEEEEEMIPVAQHFVRAKYEASAKAHGHDVCTMDDAREVLRSILPPVSPAELDNEVDKTLALIMSSNPDNTADNVNEDDFVDAIVQNTYWREAGDLVVKELIYFEALHGYYSTGVSILDDDDYNELKDNLTWEGSAVPNMRAKEALFVTAVAAARRGMPIMDDDEYQNLKQTLKKDGSWVTNREADALEKLGINTFMGYLHRAQKTSS